MYDNSIFANRANFEKFTKKPSVKAIDNDLALQYCQSKYDLMDTLASQLKDMDQELALLHKTYIRGSGGNEVACTFLSGCKLYHSSDLW